MSGDRVVPKPLSEHRRAKQRAVYEAAQQICAKYGIDDLADATADMLLEQDELIRAAGF